LGGFEDSPLWSVFFGFGYPNGKNVQAIK